MGWAFVIMMTYLSGGKCEVSWQTCESGYECPEKEMELTESELHNAQDAGNAGDTGGSLGETAITKAQVACGAVDDQGRGIGRRGRGEDVGVAGELDVDVAVGECRRHGRGRVTEKGLGGKADESSQSPWKEIKQPKSGKRRREVCEV